ncbi:uncharacterized protein LOC104891244 [Beta vulgaris subsp. vulgaris]|uniref:uncharacterized protein LOC104891244 n=1 Tax=Beta vulgaris subsp. vulgaris TaxID=3555 RepID=UPI002548E403|nr:uncharacterized protein LOC104891244 [Beta vulgaris subsp. vulgaris]
MGCFEVEDKQSWRWFLELLINDIGFHNGEGLTVMSDRQKGLIDAVETVCPKAEVRFCVRHIWANFKLQFSGTAFKESFWRAARTSSRFTFIAEMAAIKFLSQDAYNYLAAIPPKYWARHAFLTRSKSNLLLNNLCETFNSVIKEARDKPIITCLEWIRRYVMKRNTEKWDGVQTYTGRFMPFVDKVFSWVKEEAKQCVMVPSRVGEWEVDYQHDRFVVNLRDRSCSCNKWDMTGIPCIHAYACILRIRGKPEDYVDPFYSREKYMQAYGPYIKPMPGMNQWEATEFPHPLPPPIKRCQADLLLRKEKKKLMKNKTSKALMLRGLRGRTNVVIVVSWATTGPSATTLQLLQRKNPREVYETECISNPMGMEHHGGPSSPVQPNIKVAQVAQSIPPWTQSSQGSNQVQGGQQRVKKQPSKEKQQDEKSSQVSAKKGAVKKPKKEKIVKGPAKKPAWQV